MAVAGMPATSTEYDSQPFEQSSQPSDRKRIPEEAIECGISGRLEGL